MALLLFFVLLLTSATSSVATTADLTAFVFKTCNQTSQNQTFQNQPTNLTLDRLFVTLISQSSTTNFFQTTVTNITGLYQCRSDLSHTQCNTCVQKLTNTVQTSCYTARAQLVGCYMWYEVDGYHVDYPSVNRPVHEKCGVRAGTGTDFDVDKNKVLRQLVDGVGTNKGYFAKRAEYGWYHWSDIIALGQCEGDLGGGDCVDCVKTAVDFAQADCGSAYSGDVYLQKCYINYAYSDMLLDADGGDHYGGSIGGLVALMVATLFVLLQS